MPQQQSPRYSKRPQGPSPWRDAAPPRSRTGWGEAGKTAERRPLSRGRLEAMARRLQAWGPCHLEAQSCGPPAFAGSVGVGLYETCPPAPIYASQLHRGPGAGGGWPHALPAQAHLLLLCPSEQPLFQEGSSLPPPRACVQAWLSEGLGNQPQEDHRGEEPGRGERRAGHTVSSIPYPPS